MAEAVGTFNVITGVVVGSATVELRSVPDVPKVNAETEVTVPPEVAEATLADVIRPFASTVTTGILVVEPYVPGVTAVFTRSKTGFPAAPSPLVTEMSPAVPVKIRGTTVPLLGKAAIPAPDTLANEETSPFRLIVGFPDCPLPLFITIPEPLTAIILGVMVLESVFTAKPSPAAFNEAAAPCKDRLMVDCAPLSVIPMPETLESALLFGKVGS
jgi:hypothetical protein